MTAEVDADTLASFNSLLTQRGGARVFSDFQLDVAIAVVEMLKDLRNRDCSPSDRVKTAKGAADLLELLPPVIAVGAEKRIITLAPESTLHDAAAAYAAALAGDVEVEFVGPLVDAEVVPSVTPQPAPETPEPQSAPTAAPGAAAPPISPDPMPATPDPPNVAPFRRPIDFDPRLAAVSRLMHVPLREDA
jgi:hypothetical protein